MHTKINYKERKFHIKKKNEFSKQNQRKENEIELSKKPTKN